MPNNLKNSRYLNSLTDAEKKLIVKYPAQAVIVNAQKDKANSATNGSYINQYTSFLGNKPDAFRHAYWNALMAKNIGQLLAEQFATAHEQKSTSGYEADGYSKEQHKRMD